MNREELRARCLSPNKIGDKLASWDQYDIIQAQVDYLLEEQPDEFSDKDEAWQSVAQDQGLWETEWEYLLDYLEELANGRGFFDTAVLSEAHNFGWRSLDGVAVKWFSDAADMLQKVLPKTDCTFHIYGYGENGLAINNFHHDSPVGREWYYLTAVENNYCRECGHVFVEHEGNTLIADGHGLRSTDQYDVEEEVTSIKQNDACSECWEWINESYTE